MYSLRAHQSGQEGYIGRLHGLQQELHRSFLQTSEPADKCISNVKHLGLWAPAMHESDNGGGVHCSASHPQKKKKKKKKNKLVIEVLTRHIRVSTHSNYWKHVLLGENMELHHWRCACHIASGIPQ
ncbi:hypothetical protein GW17_00002560 [Ensete ventricosum]|nr:hypothetical protein GW17_00002560 [Ensete ventricosum]